MKQCIVAIPIYKESPRDLEVCSFKQVIKILRQHDIAIFTYKDLNINIYIDIANEANKTINIFYFNKAYFTNGINGYNELLLSNAFYSKFTDYIYMLIYQLDAWVFRDELSYWCSMNYDYIGAPWFKLDSKNKFTTEFDGVGNGGFSLRKISYCINLLNTPKHKALINNKNLIRQIQTPLDLIKYIIKLTGIRNNLSFYLKKGTFEDIIFSKIAQLSKLEPKIPNEKIASQFAFEVNPSFLYKKNEYSLPFGCHAYEKYEYETFWKQHIKTVH